MLLLLLSSSTPESVYVFAKRRQGTRGRTENKLLRRRQHVQRESDFILISLALEPAKHSGRVKHRSEE
jgi:hypothetical protein